MAAAPAPADSGAPAPAADGAAPPAATLSTKGSMSLNPTIAASPKRPLSPNSARAQEEASEITTNNAAKMNAALSPSGLAGVSAAAWVADGAARVQYHSPASARPNSASISTGGARARASGRSNIATMIR